MMPTLTPVDYDPFGDAPQPDVPPVTGAAPAAPGVVSGQPAAPKLTPVDYDPFEVDPGDRARERMDRLDRSIGTVASDLKKKAANAFAPVKQFGQDIGNAMVGGAEKTGLYMHAATWLGDDSHEGADALAKSIALDAQAAPARPGYADQFDADIKDAGWRFKHAEGVRDHLSAVGEAVGNVVTSPRAVARSIAEQLSNFVPAATAGAAGAGVGSLAGPIGTAVGGATGMFAGEVATEAGAKVLDLLQSANIDLRDEKAVSAALKSPGFREAARNAGLIKGGVIAAVDVAAMKLGHTVLSGPARQLEKSATSLLKRLGVDISDDAAVKAAMSSQAVKKILAPDFAKYVAATTAGRTAGRAVGALGIETAGEGVGEGLGQVASGGQTSFEDVAQEMIGGFGQSVAQTGVSAAMSGANRFAGKPAESNTAGQPATAPSAPVNEPSVSDLIGEDVGTPNVGTRNPDGSTTFPAPNIPPGALEGSHGQPPQVGDLVQWESGGQLQFQEPRRVTGITEHQGQLYATVEGSNTGIPLQELSVQKAPSTLSPADQRVREIHDAVNAGRPVPPSARNQAQEVDVENIDAAPAPASPPLVDAADELRGQMREPAPANNIDVASQDMPVENVELAPPPVEQPITPDQPASNIDVGEQPVEEIDAAPAPRETPVSRKRAWQMTRKEFEDEAAYQGVNAATEDSNPSYWFTDKADEARMFAEGERGDGTATARTEPRIDIAHKSELGAEWKDSERPTGSRHAYTGEKKNRPIRESIPLHAAADPHRYLVEQALAAGESVPAEVLADYPDLVKDKSAGSSQDVSAKADRSRASRLPPDWTDNRLARAQYRYGLRHMADEIEKGGGVAYKQDENGTITGRTPSLNPAWYQSMQQNPDYKMSVADVQKAVKKALAGEKLGVREARVVGAMLEQVHGERGEQVDYAKQQLESARKFRKTAAEAIGITDKDVEQAGELFRENAYPAHWDGPTRTLYELADQARQVDEQSTQAAFESGQSDSAVAKRLAEIIHGNPNANRSAEETGAGQEAQAAPQAQGAQEARAPGAENGAVKRPLSDGEKAIREGDARDRAAWDEATNAADLSKVSTDTLDQAARWSGRILAVHQNKLAAGRESTLQDSVARGLATDRAAIREELKRRRAAPPKGARAQLEAKRAKKADADQRAPRVTTENPTIPGNSAVNSGKFGGARAQLEKKRARTKGQTNTTAQQQQPIEKTTKESDISADKTKLTTTSGTVPLYASRPVTNAADIIEWAKQQGFPSTLSPDDLHVTVAYSREPVKGKSVKAAVGKLSATDGKRSVEKLGDEGAVVLKFESPDLQKRWQEYRDAGASWDYDQYMPHVTITYDGGKVDLSKVKPYSGPIHLGDEKQAPLNVDKADDYKATEKPTKPADELNKQAKTLNPAAPVKAAKKDEGKFAASFDAEDDGFSAALKFISEHDEAFTYPKSTAKDFEQVAKDVAAGAFTDLKVTKFPSASKTSKEEARYIISIGAKDKKGRVRAAQLRQYKNGTLEMDISDSIPGDAGSAIYQMVGDYAHNTGRVFVGDRHGLSATAQIRRTEAMLSSALRWGTTQHLHPHDLQVSPEVAGVRPLGWKVGNDAHNMRELARTQFETMIRLVPEIRGFDYNSDTGQFVDKAGKEISDAKWDKIVTESRDRRLVNADTLAEINQETPSGRRSLKRSVWLRWLSREASGPGWGRLLAGLSQQHAESSGSGSTARIIPPKIAYARGESAASEAPPSAGLSASGVRDYLTAKMGPRAIRALIDSGKFKIVLSDDNELPPRARAAVSENKRIYGYFDPATQTSYIIADRLTDAGKKTGILEDAYSIFLHEVGVHYGMRQMLGGLFDKVVAKVAAAAESGKGALGEAAAAARKRMSKKTLPEDVNEETLAWLVTDRSNHKLNVVQKVIAKIRAFLVSKGFTKAISPDALVDLARGAAMRAGGEHVNGGGMFAAGGITDTDAFRRWFGDSKVVDKDGAPLVVYHGTENDFSAFDKSKGMTGPISGNPIAKHGFFFSDKPMTAEIYSSLAPGSNLMPTYLSIKNPAHVDMWSGMSAVTDSKGRWVDEKVESWVADLKKKGHDGIIFKGGDSDYREYMAFEPTQIKSATGNNGNFDSNNPDIRFAAQDAEDVETSIRQPATKARTGLRQRARQLVKAIDAKLTPLATMEGRTEYLTSRYLTLGRIAQTQQTARRIYDMFRKLSDADGAKVYAYLTDTEGTLEGVDPAVKANATRVKAMIDETGRALVERGVIPQESFEKYEGRYLPRVYLAYLLGDKAVKAVGAGKTLSQQSYAKSRNENLPQEYRDLVLGEIKDPAFLASRALGVPLRDLAILNWLSQIAENPAWVLPGQTVEWTMPGFEKSRKVTPYWLKSEATSLRERAQHYQGQNKADAMRLAADMDATADGALSEAGIAVDQVPDGYKQIPNSARYGAVRGLIVKADIYDDIVGVGRVSSTDASLAEKVLGYGGIGSKITGWWKWSKVAANPPAQIRNVLSNMVLLHLSGVPMHKLPGLIARAAKEVRTKGRFYQIGMKYGVTESTFAAQEMQRIERETMDYLVRTKGRFGLTNLKDYFLKFAEWTGDVYQSSEMLGKLVKIIDSVEREGKSEADAAMAAQEWLFDYSLVGQNVRYLRSAPIGAPFLTFAVKVLPRMLEVAITAPWRFLPYAGLFYASSLLVQSLTGADDDDLDKLKKALPEWLQERGHVMMLPVKDEHGRWQFVDLGYFFPWTYWTELAGTLGGTVKDLVTKGETDKLGQALTGSGLLGGPIPDLIAAIKTGRDPFTERDITDEHMTAGEKLNAMLTYLYGMAMPPWLTGIPPFHDHATSKGAAGHIYEALTGATDKHGEPRDTVGQAFLRLGGVNVYPIEPEKARQRNILFKQYDISKTKSLMRSIARDKSLDPDKRKELVDDYKAKITRDVESLRQYIKDSAVSPKLR